MADAATLRRLHALEQQVAALQGRTGGGATGPGPGQSTLHGVLNSRPIQAGFPVETTHVWSTAAGVGYRWKRLLVEPAESPMAVAVPDNPLTGQGAVTPDEDTSLPVGTRGWLRPTPEGTAWVLTTAGGAGSTTAGSCGCGWFAGASDRHCFRLTVVEALGAFDDLDTDQTLDFEWDAVNDYWESTTDFTVCGYTGRVRLSRASTGDPLLYLVNPGYYLTIGCCDKAAQTVTFTGGNSGGLELCPWVTIPSADCPDEDAEDTSGPADNTFTVQVAYLRCPNEDWSEAGWYCIATTDCDGERHCCYLAEDPGPLVVICSGPHADEATCAAACTDPPTVPVDVCELASVDIPETLFVTITGATGTVAGLAGTVIQVDYVGTNGLGQDYWFGSTEVPALSDLCVFAIVVITCFSEPPFELNLGVKVGCRGDGCPAPTNIVTNIAGTGNSVLATFSPVSASFSGTLFDTGGFGGCSGYAGDTVDWLVTE